MLSANKSKQGIYPEKRQDEAVDEEEHREKSPMTTDNKVIPQLKFTHTQDLGHYCGKVKQ